MQKSQKISSLEKEKKGNVLIVKAKHKLDALSAPTIEKELFELIHLGEKKILFDFSEVDYLSSTGMRMLLSIAKKLRTNSGKMVLCSLPHHILDLLKISGFDHVLDIVQDQEEALKKL